MAIKIQNSTIIDDSRNIINAGVVTAQSFVGNLTGTATTATFLSDAANITTGTISTDRLSGTYNINITGVAGEVTYTTYADIAGISTFAGISTNVIGGIASVTNLTVSGVSTFNSSVGIGTTNSTAALYVVGDSYITGILTANRIFSNVYGEFTGGGISGTNIVGTALSISGISTLGITSVTHLDAQSINSSGIITGSTFRPSTGYIQSPNGTNSFYIYDGTGNVAFQGTIGASQINNASGNKIIGFAGTNNATFENHVYIAGITTSVGGFVGNLTGTATTATNLADAANITTGTINSARLTGTYGISVTGSASTASFATTAYNLTDAANITAGTINASRLSGTYTISISGNAATANYASTAGIATYATNAGVSTNVIGGIASVTNLTVSGVSTFNSSVGIGTTNPTSALYVVGDSYITGILTANRIVSSVYGEFTGGGISGTNIVGTALSISGISTLGVTSVSQLYVSGVTTSMGGFVGNLTGTASTASFATTAFNLTDAANITAGTISTARLTGTYNIDINGNATTAIDANFAGYATNAGVATYASTAGVATALQNSRTFEITGDIIASPISFNGTGNVSLAATIQPNSVGLGTDTTGNYVQSITGTANEIEVTGGSGEGSTPQIGLPNDIIIANNLSVGGVTTSTGGFVGNLTGTASTSSFATTAFNLTDAANITTGTINSARLAGTYNIDISGNASTATYATNAGIATYATNAGVSTYAVNAGVSTYANTAGIATYAVNAGIATYATNAGIATYAVNAGVSTYAVNAGVATYATSSGIATYATNAGVATALQNSRTFEITGDIIASPISFNGTGNVSLAATIQPNSVGLGTDTFGDYVKDITGTANQITVTSGTGEGSTPVLSIPSQFTVPQDLTVLRDVQIDRNLNVNGNITIGGTTAFINVQQLTVSDPDLVLGFRTDINGNDSSNDNTANHGGIAVASTEGNPLVQLFIAGIETTPATYKKIMWFKAGEFAGLGTDAWLMNYAVGVGSTQFPTGTRLAAGSVQLTENDIAAVRNINASGIVTASGGFVGSLTGTASTASFATTAFNLENAANITTGTINSARLTGTYNIDISGNAATSTYAVNAGIATYAVNAGISTYADVAGIATYATNAGVATYADVAGIATYATNAGVSTNVIGGIASVANLTVSGVSTFSDTVYVGSGITFYASSGIVSATAFYGNGENLSDIIKAKLSGITLYEDGVQVGTPYQYSEINVVGNYVTATGIGSTATITFTTPPYADVAGIATYATNAGIATYADVAGIATYATNAGVSTYAETAGIATSVINNPGVGVATAGGTVGTGATILDFRGPGISTITVSAGIATISIENLTQIDKQSFEVGAGGTSIFNLNQSYDSGYIDVYINGVRLSTSSFTETSPTVITLTEPANPGDVVEFQSFKQLVNTSSLWNNSFNGIYTNDNVGIGLTDPSAKLEINGTTKIKGFVETQSSSTISNNILNLNANNGTVFSHTTTENIGIVSFTGISTSGASNQTFTVLVTQGATPYNTTAATGIGTQLATIVTSDGVGYSTHIKVGGGTTITLTNSAGALDVLTFIVSYNGNVSVSNTSFTVIGFAATDFRGVI